MLKEQNQEKQQAQQLEETYERMYGKIARDFPNIADLVAYIDLLRLALDGLGVKLPPFNPSLAKLRGLEYKNNIEKGKDIAKKYKDVVVIDESGEED